MYNYLQEENEEIQSNGGFSWPKSEKKDSLTAPDNLTLFIGKCQDIDEMLGAPSPVSPGSTAVANASSPSQQQQPFKFDKDATPTKV